MATEDLQRAAVRVRAGRESDIAEIARVHVASWSSAYRGIISASNLAATTIPRSVARFRGYFRAQSASPDPRSLLDVVESQGYVAGYVNAGAAGRKLRRQGVGGEVFELYVDPDHQGLGLGRKLLSAALWGLAAEGCVPTIVWVLRDNHRARRFYARMGGVPVARGRVEVGDQRLEKVAYEWSDQLPWPEWITGA